MENIFIHQHLGLGDHIVCNGLIREICKSNNNYYLAVKNNNFDSVEYMFRDIKNLKCVRVVDGENSEIDASNQCLKLNCKLLKIGHEFFISSCRFDQSFYKQLGIDFQKRWDSFYFERDYAKEEKFFNSLNLPNKYIFINEDIERKVFLTRIENKKDFHYRSNKHLTKNIFDYIKVLENAEEIHLMESSFLFICDSLNLKGKLYIHRYARYIPPNFYPSLKNNWTILT